VNPPLRIRNKLWTPEEIFFFPLSPRKSKELRRNPHFSSPLEGPPSNKHRATFSWSGLPPLFGFGKIFLQNINSPSPSQGEEDPFSPPSRTARNSCPLPPHLTLFFSLFLSFFFRRKGLALTYDYYRARFFHPQSENISSPPPFPERHKRRPPPSRRNEFDFFFPGYIVPICSFFRPS